MGGLDLGEKPTDAFSLIGRATMFNQPNKSWQSVSAG
jgi:hypothetical protein